MRFGRKGKLNHRYIGHFKILRTVGDVAYELVSTLDFAVVHPIFHVPMLQ